ncbi:MAG TPA: hypothetical protein P5191_14920 [Ruminococcus sp.]|nr:hypothetical protein [Ruminococcus sp.]
MTTETLKEIAIWMILVPLGIMLIPNILVPFDHWCSGTHEFSPEARYQRKLRRELRHWTSIMLCSDPEWEPEDYAVAVRKVKMLREELGKEVNKKCQN